MRLNISGLALVLAICVLPACQSSQKSVASHEDDLAAAGFLVRPANTPARQDMLARLPPHKFVRRASGDTVHYVYADPSVCNCLYVGTQTAYAQYQQNKQSKQEEKALEKSLDQHNHAAEDDDLNEQVYSDPNWNWSAWGPWGPEYGYAPGLGW